MEKQAIIFRSPKPDLEVVVRNGTIERFSDGRYKVDPGRSVKFSLGVLPIPFDDQDALDALRKSRLYGVEIFEDTVAQATVVQEAPASSDPEKDALLKQIEELKAMLAAQFQSKADSTDDLPKDFNELKALAKRMGIDGERDWKRPDWENAIRNVKGAQ
jgi:hypothetical protein